VGDRAGGKVVVLHERLTMSVKFQQHELPYAYSMITFAQKIRPHRDGQHHFQKYFYLWTAFNNIYTTFAHRQGMSTRLVRSEDGKVLTVPNGNVNIPRVESVSEREKLYLALDEFDDELKHRLIVHKSTRFFLERIPAWKGGKIEHDAFGQRVNGVINVNHTCDADYPIWSPIDIQFYERYAADPDDEDCRNFLATQIVDLLYTVRDNLMHAGRKLDDANDISVVENALPLLEMIVASFTW